MRQGADHQTKIGAPTKTPQPPDPQEAPPWNSTKKKLEARIAQAETRANTAMNIIEAIFNRVDESFNGNQLVDRLKQLSKDLDKQKTW